MSVPQPPPLPRLIGHRGAAGHAPENTLAGLRHAAMLGAAWVEFDTMLSADGAAILFHDDRLDRTTNVTGTVAEMKLAALQALDAGSWFGPEFRGEKVPTLRQAIRLLAEIGLAANIEIKPTPGRAVETGRTVARIVAEEWPPTLPAPILSSFDPEALSAARPIVPNVPRGLIVSRIPKDWKDRLHDLGCASFHCNHRHLTRPVARDIRAAGFRLLAYTVNEPERGRTLFDWGIESVFTDYPDRFRSI